MACLGCNKTCSCALVAGAGIVVSGTGNTGSPWTISAVGASEFVDDSCSITMGGDGSLADPLIATLIIATSGGLKCTDAIGVGIKVDPASTSTVTFSTSGIKINNGVVFVDAPCLDGDGTAGDPITLVVDPVGGLDCGVDGLTILLDPATDPGCASLSADGLFIDCGGGGGGTVSVTDPITGDGSGGDPLALALAAAGGLDVAGGELEILLDPASDPACVSLSAAGLLISCGGGGGGGGSSTVIIEDDFVRADESPVGPTPIGNSSPRAGGIGTDWQVVSNQLASSGAIGENMIVWGADSGQFVFECTVDVPSSDGGVVFGADRLLGTHILINTTGVGTNYNLYYRNWGGYSASYGTGIAPTPSANGDVLKLIVDGINWSFWINGVKNWDTVGSVGFSPVFHDGPRNAGFRDNGGTAFRCSHIKITSTCCGSSGGGNNDVRWTRLASDGSASAQDDEFRDGSIDVKWSRVDTSGHTGYVTWLEGADSLNVTVGNTADAAAEFHAYMQAHALAVGDSISCRVDMGGAVTSYPLAGLIIADGVTVGAGKQVIFGAGDFTSGASMLFNKSVTGYDTEVASTDYNDPTWNRGFHLKILRDVSDVFRLYWSLSGVQWYEVGTRTLVMTPSHIGVAVSSYTSGTKHQFAFDYFRRQTG